MVPLLMAQPAGKQRGIGKLASPPQAPPTIGVLDSSRLVQAERNIVTDHEAIGTIREELNTLVGALFAVVIAVAAMGLVIETRVRRAVRWTSKRSTEIREELDGHVGKATQEFHTELSRLATTVLSSRTANDLALAGKVLYWTSKHDEAVTALDEALALVPEDADALKFRGLALRRLGPTRWSEAATDLSRYLTLVGGGDREAILELGHTLVQLRDFERVLTLVRTAETTGWPNREELQLLAGDALRGLRRPDDAMFVYDDVIAANPRCTPAILGKAVILHWRGQLDEMIALYTDAISQRHGVSKYHVFRAQAYSERDKEGDWPLALSDFEAAERINERDWDLWFERGRSHLRRALARHEFDEEAHQLVAEAIRHFEYGIRVSRKTGAPRFQNQLCRCHLLLGHAADALKMAQESVRTSPQFIQNHLTLVTTLLALRKWAQAAKAATDAWMRPNLGGGRIWLTFFLGVAEAMQGFDAASIDERRRTLEAELSALPGFESDRWDWSAAQSSVTQALEGIDPGCADVVRTMIGLIQKSADPTTLSDS